MADQLQLRGGTTSQILAFTGAQREVVVDTTTHALVVQDGITAGGFPTATATQLKNATFYYNEDVGSAANAYILTPKANTTAPSSYQDGVQFGFVTAFPNSGPSTANFQGLGVKNLKYPGGVDPLAGEISGRTYLIYDSVNDWMEIQRKALGPPPQIRTIGGTVAGSALTVTLAPCFIEFRSATLGSGTITGRNVASTINLVVPSGATLGTVSAVQSRLIVLAIFGPSNVELAIVNASGGLNLDESGLLSTSAIGAGSTLAGTAYSTVARASVPYRVLGYIESTQATAGTWATAPSTIQGQGGEALAAMASIGYSQTWQDVTGSRALTTVFTNTTGKPIMIAVSVASSTAATLSLSVNGVIVIAPAQNTPAINNAATTIVPGGGTYSAILNSGTPSGLSWKELR